MDQQRDDELGNKWDEILANLVESKFSEKLNELEHILNYKFKRRNLLEEALTHSSATPRGFTSYECLEFLRDAVLGQLIAAYLYRSYPDLKPGSLTLLRSQNVGNETLARVAIKHRFFHYLRFDSSDVQHMIQRFIQVIEKESKPCHYNNSKAPKILADIVESIVGAVFVDSGNSADRVWEVFELLLQPLVGPESLEMHPVTALQELCQKYGKCFGYKEFIGDNNMVTVDVWIDGQIMGSAENEIKELAKRQRLKMPFQNFKTG